MEIKDIEKVLTQASSNPNDESIKAEYTKLITEYLKANKSSSELISIVVKGIDIDCAANYYDHLETITKNDLQSLWKQIKDNPEIKDNGSSNGLKFIVGLLSLSFLKVGNMEFLSGNIIDKLILMISNKKKPISSEIYKPIILDYFVDDFPPIFSFPRWDSFKVDGDTNKKFAELILEVTDDEKKEHQYRNIRHWANVGLQFAEELIEKEKIEAKIPESKIDALKAIAEHYNAVEKQVRDYAYEIAKSEKTIKDLQSRITKLTSDKQELEWQIKALNKEVANLQEKVEKRDAEIEGYKTINTAVNALREHNEKGLIETIGYELRFEYKDFLSAKDDKMDEELGEICRGKLEYVYKYLMRKGVKFEQYDG